MAPTTMEPAGQSDDEGPAESGALGAEDYLQTATVLRKVAGHLTHPQSIKRLLTLAAHYERLADFAVSARSMPLAQAQQTDTSHQS